MTLAEFLLARIAEDEARVADARRLEDYMPYGAWDLDRVQAECEAKRRIVNRARGWIDEPDVTATSIIANDLLGHVLSCLALPYAEHPDYDEAWRP